MGNEQSRRDDLEALGLVTAYFVTSKLPWMGIKVKTRKEKEELLISMKRDLPFEDFFPGCPQEFIDYMKFVRNMEFEAKPDYNQCRGFFQRVMDKNEWTMDYEYDWVIKKREAAAKA